MKTQLKRSELKMSSRIVITCLLVILSMNGFAQKQTITILNIDAQNINLTPQQLGNLVRLEVEKLDTFNVIDKYDVAYLVEKNSLKTDNCYGKIGLVDVGSKISSDKMLTGSIEVYGQTMIVTLRLIDVKKSIIEKTFVKEFLNLPAEIQTITRVSINLMFNRPIDEVLVSSITQKTSYDNAINNPFVNKINLSGPRMGFAYEAGPNALVLADSKTNGGFDAFPVLFQIGYQFEKQYLNSGNYQALFEFIPMFTLINDKKISPNIAALNGLRSTKNGWEFACGLTFGFTSMLNDKFDSRGKSSLTGGFVVAIGKTFKSGKLNIPLNLYLSPSKEGVRFGLSFGFNAKKMDGSKM